MLQKLLLKDMCINGFQHIMLKNDKGHSLVPINVSKGTNMNTNTCFTIFVILALIIASAIAFCDIKRIYINDAVVEPFGRD